MWGWRQAWASDPGEIRSLFRRIRAGPNLAAGGVTRALRDHGCHVTGPGSNRAACHGPDAVGLTYGQTRLFLGTQQLRLAALSALISKGLFLAVVLLLVKTPADAIPLLRALWRLARPVRWHSGVGRRAGPSRSAWA